MAKEFGYKNVMAIPKIAKMVVNMGLGEATQNAKIVDTGADEIARITGQKPVDHAREEVHRAVQAAQGHAHRHDGHAARRADVGLPRSSRVGRAAARARLPRRVAEGLRRPRQLHAGTPGPAAFPEIDYMKVDKARGMNISVVTTAKTDEESRTLLQLLGMPFRSAVATVRDKDDSSWPRLRRSPRKAKTMKCTIRLRNRCKRCGRPAPTCASSRSADCASASWRSRVTSQA